MGERSVGWSTGFWLLSCASLAAIVGLELSSEVSIAPQVTAAPPPAPLAEGAPAAQSFEAPPEDAFDEIALRPLFFESRRPFVPPPSDVVAEGVAPEKKVSVELVGTLVTDQGRAALLQPDGQPAVWRREGEKIAGWKVRKIDPDQITLGLGDEIETLTLRADQVTPVKPPRAGKRKRRERAAKREDAPQPEPAAATQTTSN
jgi:hypothetical protein